MTMKFETVLTGLAIVVIGGLAIWFTFGPIVMNAIDTVVNVLMF